MPAYTCKSTNKKLPSFTTSDGLNGCRQVFRQKGKDREIQRERERQRETHREGERETQRGRERERYKQRKEKIDWKTHGGRDREKDGECGRAFGI